MYPLNYFYRGLDRFVARSRLWLDLETAGLALRAEPYSLRVPRSQRGGEVCTIDNCFLAVVFVFWQLN